MVHAVHGAGATPARIGSVLADDKFLGVDGVLDGDRLVEAFTSAHPDVPAGQWFFREPVHHDGHTWVVSSSWGAETRSTLTALVALVPGAGVSYSQS
jgi:hypothetical protein